MLEEEVAVGESVTCDIIENTVDENGKKVRPDVEADKGTKLQRDDSRSHSQVTTYLQGGCGGH